MENPEITTIAQPSAATPQKRYSHLELERILAHDNVPLTAAAFGYAKASNLVVDILEGTYARRRFGGRRNRRAQASAVVPLTEEEYKPEPKPEPRSSPDAARYVLPAGLRGFVAAVKVHYYQRTFVRPYNHVTGWHNLHKLVPLAEAVNDMLNLCSTQGLWSGENNLVVGPRDDLNLPGKHILRTDGGTLRTVFFKLLKIYFHQLTHAVMWHYTDKKFYNLGKQRKFTTPLVFLASCKDFGSCKNLSPDGKKLFNVYLDTRDPKQGLLPEGLQAGQREYSLGHLRNMTWRDTIPEWYFAYDDFVTTMGVRPWSRTGKLGKKPETKEARPVGRPKGSVLSGISRSLFTERRNQTRRQKAAEFAKQWWSDPLLQDQVPLAKLNKTYLEAIQKATPLPPIPLDVAESPIDEVNATPSPFKD